MNLAVVRHIAFNILKRDTSKLSLKRKRLKASVNPDFRGQPCLLTIQDLAPWANPAAGDNPRT
ncbi:MAG: hypothetical protein WBF43_05600 [Methylocella sp.]